MASETPMIYSEETLFAAALLNDEAREVASILGIDAAAVMAPVLEEINDIDEGVILGLFGRSKQVLVDVFVDVSFYSHEQIAAAYEVQSVPMMRDIGFANIQVYTAIRLLNDYVSTHPNSDPLNLKQYSSDYLSLVNDLNTYYTKLPIVFAGLMVAEGLRWGAANVDNWHTLSADEKNGFASYYYNVGREFMENRRDQEVSSHGAYNVNIDDTDIAQEFLLNSAAIRARLADTYWSDLRDAIRSGEVTECFLPGTPVLLPDHTTRSIESLRPGDQLLSYDAFGALVPGRVVRVIRSRVRHVLDVFGLMVTPGHVTLCGDGPYAGRHVPILDILRTDGALVRADGSLVRASTGADVGSEADRMMWVVAGRQGPSGFEVVEAREMRRGTRVLTEAGHDFSLAELVFANGGTVTEGGLVACDGSEPAPFAWPFGVRLPLPEDYVLQRSAVTLHDIYCAAEWEDVRPHLPGPVPQSADGPPPADVGPRGPASLRPRAAVRPNLPLALAEERRTRQLGARTFGEAMPLPVGRVQ